MSVVARMRTTIPPGPRAWATGSATRSASTRASATRHGEATPSRSQSAALSTSTSSTAGPASGSSARPATRGFERSQPPSPPLKQLDVGVAETVDRLLGVADREQVVAGDRLDELQLNPVGVLEL